MAMSASSSCLCQGQCGKEHGAQGCVPERRQGKILRATPPPQQLLLLDPREVSVRAALAAKPTQRASVQLVTVRLEEQCLCVCRACAARRNNTIENQHRRKRGFWDWYLNRNALLPGLEEDVKRPSFEFDPDEEDAFLAEMEELSRQVQAEMAAARRNLDE